MLDPKHIGSSRADWKVKRTIKFQQRKQFTAYGKSNENIRRKGKS